MPKRFTVRSRTDIKKSALAGAFSIGDHHMTCKDCGREIPENSIFCNWCGSRQLRERREREEIRVPTPKQLPSGSWNIVLRAEGVSVTEPTREKCLARARALRAGFLTERREKAARGLTLGEAIDEYIEGQENILSPSTLVGYRNIRGKRFRSLMGKPLSEITPSAWKNAVNAEAREIGAKTVRNAWGLVAAALNAQGLEVPAVSLPRATAASREWLDYEQILTFCEQIRGSDIEIAALLALLSLRRSEICALKWSDIDLARQVIHVRSAKVDTAGGAFEVRNTTKTARSTRDVAILIPRLAELLKEGGEGFIVEISPRTLGYRINRHCLSAGLPPVGTHGLRHSFASLAYHLGVPEAECMQMGGWSSVSTMRKIYTHIAAQDAEKHAAAISEFFKNADNFTNEN